MSMVNPPLAKFLARVASRSAQYKLMDEPTLRLCYCLRRHPPAHGEVKTRSP
jgi:hypothetical protein